MIECSGVTEGMEVMRAHRPRKKNAQIKVMFFNENNIHLHQESKRKQT